MQDSNFFASLSRMKHIQRWSLMRNNDGENLMEHSLMVSMIAHGIAVLHNRGEGEKVDVGQVVLHAVYHDASEVLTGDLPTPIKYHNPNIKTAFKDIEALATQRLLEQVPEDLRVDFLGCLAPDPASPHVSIVKAADKISAWIKCVEERRTGNQEFIQAERTIAADIASMDLPAAKEWMERFAGAFEMSLDQLHLPDNPNP